MLKAEELLGRYVRCVEKGASIEYLGTELHHYSIEQTHLLQHTCLKLGQPIIEFNQ